MSLALMNDHERSRDVEIFGADLDRRWMSVALRAARRGRPSPNPHVGAVLARGRELIAIGHHERVGQAHAEVVALTRAGARARGATLYVTLEPCNHYGRTGPCTHAIIEAQVARVVFGACDPAPHVPGAAARLAEAGIAVDGPLCEVEARRLVDDFAKHFTTGVPFVTLAGRVDGSGQLDVDAGDVVHGLHGAMRRRWLRERAASDAVLLGDVADVIAADAAVCGAELRGILVELGRRNVVRLRVEACAAAAPAFLRQGEVDRVSLICDELAGRRRRAERESCLARISAALQLVAPRLIERDGDVLIEADVAGASGSEAMTAPTKRALRASGSLPPCQGNVP